VAASEFDKDASPIDVRVLLFNQQRAIDELPPAIGQPFARALP
jgi:hypothetical protein